MYLSLEISMFLLIISRFVLTSWSVIIIVALCLNSNNCHLGVVNFWFSFCFSFSFKYQVIWDYVLNIMNIVSWNVFKMLFEYWFFFVCLSRHSTWFGSGCKFLSVSSGLSLQFEGFAVLFWSIQCVCYPWAWHPRLWALEFSFEILCILFRVRFRVSSDSV
jgi:hypothetical protein